MRGGGAGAGSVLATGPGRGGFATITPGALPAAGTGSCGCVVTIGGGALAVV